MNFESKLLPILRQTAVSISSQILFACVIEHAGWEVVQMTFIKIEIW